MYGNRGIRVAPLLSMPKMRVPIHPELIRFLINHHLFAEDNGKSRRIFLPWNMPEQMGDHRLSIIKNQREKDNNTIYCTYT